MDRALSGGQVQKLSLGRLGAHEVVLLQVRLPGRTAHVIIAGGLGVGTIDPVTRERLRDAAEAVVSTQSHWRARVERARVSALDEQAVFLVRDGAAWRASATGDGTLALTRDAFDGDARSLGEDALQERGRRVADQLLLGQTGDRRETVRRALKKAALRLERRVAAVQSDIGKMTAAEERAARARLFVAEAARAPRGATVLRAIDWSTGIAETLEYPLDPAKGAQEQITATFRRARRMKEGANIALTRLEEAKTTLEALHALLARIAEPEVDLARIEALARTSAPRDLKLAASHAPAPRGPSRDVARPPYRKFFGTSGLPILVGRGATQNDDLTLHVARPHDLWLHAKGRTGAHVIVPLRKETSCPAELLVEAAHLAAHFSEARGESIVDVQYASRRYVRKPRGSAPGAVLVDREKVMAVRMRSDLLHALLGSEAEVSP